MKFLHQGIAACIAFSAMLHFTLTPCFAQSVVIAVDDAVSRGGPPAIDSLDLYENGLYWTSYGGNCSGAEFAIAPSVAVLFVRNPPGAEHYVVLNCPGSGPAIVGGAVRDDSFAYYTTPEGVRRKGLAAGPSDPSLPIGPAWASLIPGAVMAYNGRAYYAYSAPAGPISGVGYFAIEYFTLPGSRYEFEPTTRVAHGDSLPNVGRVIKLGSLYRRTQTFGVALTSRGYLLRFPLEQSGNAPPATILATGVTDFAVREEEYQGGQFTFFQDTLYVSISSLCPSDPTGQIIKLSPESLTRVTVWSGGPHISAIGADQEYLFASTYGRQLNGATCLTAGNGVIRSKRLPAVLNDPNPSGVDPNWDAIEASIAGSNLRSDGHYLYFTRGKEVRRIANNSPPVRHDFAALGLEAVQVVQDLYNSVRLVEGKRTVVRAYAWIPNSSLSQPDWYPNAQLRGYLNGVELPGSPIGPVNGARVTHSFDYQELRPDARRSFQFELPSLWVRSGDLTLRFTVNPNLATYESGATPLANNTYEAPNIRVVRVPPLCLVFAAMDTTTAPHYWPWENSYDFGRIMERAKSMLPVPDIHIHPTTENISDEHVCVRTCEGPLGISYPCGFVCNSPFNFGNDDDWSEALDELADCDAFEHGVPGCRTHFVGAIHPAVQGANWVGAERGGAHLLAVMEPDPRYVHFNSAYGGRTIAHELGHNLGRLHVDQTTCLYYGGTQPENSDPNYPYDGCAFDNLSLNNGFTAMGFDMVTFSPVSPTWYTSDLMSYATLRWPSTYTYNAMLDALPPEGTAAPAEFSAAPAPPAGPYLLVRGTLKLAQAKATLKGCYTLAEGVADPVKVQASLAAAVTQPAHGYVLRKLNGAGAALEETPLVIVQTEDADDNTVVLHQFITKPVGMTAVQVLKAGAVLAECRATPRAPVVSAITATYDAQGPSLRISIDASDADSDPMRFSVQFSNDNGAAWRTLRVNHGSFSFVANPRFLPGGTQCRVRVIATDGFNSAVATSNPFALPRHAPESFISGVRAGERLAYGTNASLLGFALDAEDGSLSGASLDWALSGPTPMAGSNAWLSLAGLSPGSYTATLTANDSEWNKGVTTLRFEVLPLVVRDGEAPSVDGEANDATYAGAASLTPALSARTKAYLTHSGGDLYVAFTDLPYGTPTVRALVGLHVDVNASGDSSVQSSDVGFYVNEDGVPEQYEGDGTQMRLRTNPSPGFKAVITRGVSGWNAEFRIADSLIGGWNHLVRIGCAIRWADTPLFAWWPSSLNANSPATWAPAWFGTTPPTPANLPPVAKAEMPPHINVNGPETIVLNGSASFDPEGAALSFAWSQVSGPAVTLNNATTATPSFTLDAQSASTFRFRLMVNDGQLNSSLAEVQFTLSPESGQSYPLQGLIITPQEGLTSSGLLGGPFNAGAKTYVLSNSASSSITWTARKTADWVSLSADSGTLAANATATVTVSINGNANGLASGNFWDTVTFANTTTGAGNTTRLVSLTIRSGNEPGLAVYPKEVIFFSSGPEGGPFSPVTQTYILSNSANASLNWTASSIDPRLLTPSAMSGTLAPGATAAVTLSINTNTANTLPGGGYAATVYFMNTTTGFGDTYRNLYLVVTAGLTVSPDVNLQAMGITGGPFTPGSQIYELRNVGNRNSLNWTASHSSNWVSLSAAAGTLAPGASTTIVISLNTNADSLTAGDYTDRVSFATDGGGTETRNVEVRVSAGLSLVLTNGFVGAGPVGGPFSNVGFGGPSYQLVNASLDSISWRLIHAPSWLSVSVTEGTLTPSASESFTVSFNANANSLPAGHYSDTVVFRNLNSPRNEARLPVELRIGSGPLVLTWQPRHYTVSPGASVTFSVLASGLEPISYQWSHYGTHGGLEPIAGATDNSTLTLANVTDRDAGRYEVSATNPETNAIAQAGTLAVLSLRLLRAGFSITSQLELYGAFGDRYRIDYTDALGTNGWTELGTFSVPTTVSDFSNVPMRFYRAVYLDPRP